MQDRFRFRILEKEDKVMYEVDALGYSSYDPFAEGKSRLIMIPSGIYNSFAYNKQCLYDSEKFSEPMQCTGLKDKNGKLIYEGDILRVIGNRDTSGYGVVEYLQAGCQFFINGYLNNPSPYHPQKKGEFYQQLQEWLCTEVIGNIYENTELLEVHHD